MSRPIYIFDLDGTLANADHRKQYIDEKNNPKRWREFYAACDRDRPITHVISVMHRLRHFADILIWTGRSEEVRAKTIAWLSQHTSFMQHEIEAILTMRQEGDHRGDDIVKREWLDALELNDRVRIEGVFEDRDRVVAMWRAAGLQCFQVAPGDF